MLCNMYVSATVGETASFTFRVNIENEGNIFLKKCRYIGTKLHDVTFQNTVIFVVAATKIFLGL
jgi:hypothetical protein